MNLEMNQCPLSAISYSIRMRENDFRGPAQQSRESKEQELRQALGPTYQLVTSCSCNLGPDTVRIPTEDLLNKLKNEQAS